MTPETFAKLMTYIMAAILGLCVGSFLNVLIYRLPNGLSLIKPPSHCPSCKRQIRPYDNIPVISYLILGGKCRYCKTRIPIRYTMVEIINTLLWIFTVAAFYDEGYLSMIAKALVLSFLLTAFFTDLEKLVIPNTIPIALLLFGILLCFSHDPLSVKERFFGLLLGGVGFLAVYLISYFIYKREALGFGDVKLMAALGFVLGWKATFLTVLLASISAGLVLFIIGRIRKDKRSHEYPLAPFLTAAGAFALFFGNDLVNWYIGLFAFI